MSMKETRGTDTEGERLQKVIANAGVTSRRNAEIMIEERRVKVNGKIINQLGYKVKRSDKIEVDGTALSLQGKNMFISFYINLYGQ